MSKTTKISLGIVIAIIVITIIYMSMPQSSTAPEVSAPVSTADTGVSSSTDTSDAAITQDMNTIDTQLNNLDASQKTVDASLNN